MGRHIFHVSRSKRILTSLLHSVIIVANGYHFNQCGCVRGGIRIYCILFCKVWMMTTSVVILFAYSATEITATQTWAKANSYFLQNSFWKPYVQNFIFKSIKYKVFRCHVCATFLKLFIFMQHFFLIAFCFRAFLVQLFNTALTRPIHPEQP